MRLVSDQAWAVMTVWGEASSEDHDGRVAVCETIRNRMKLRLRSDGTVAGTVLSPLQYSFWNATASRRRIAAANLDTSDPLPADCVAAWVESETSNLTNGATHYVNTALAQPSWLANAYDLVVIGRHTFCKLVNP